MPAQHDGVNQPLLGTHCASGLHMNSHHLHRSAEWTHSWSSYLTSLRSYSKWEGGGDETTPLWLQSPSPASVICLQGPWALMHQRSCSIWEDQALRGHSRGNNQSEACECQPRMGHQRWGRPGSRRRMRCSHAPLLQLTNGITRMCRLLRTYHVLGTVLSVLHALTHPCNNSTR